MSVIDIAVQRPRCNDVYGFHGEISGAVADAYNIASTLRNADSSALLGQCAYRRGCPHMANVARCLLEHTQRDKN